MGKICSCHRTINKHTILDKHKIIILRDVLPTLDTTKEKLELLDAILLNNLKF